MKIQAQFTYEGCLAWCLQYLAGETPTLKREIEIINYSLRFSKKDFTLGHLESVSSSFKELQLYMDASFRREFNSCVQLRKSKNIDLISCNVPIVFQFFLDEVLKKFPVAVYIDSYALWGYNHYPHWIIVKGVHERKVEIIDPWNGRSKLVKEEVLLLGFEQLRNLGFSPKMISTK